MNGRCVNSRQKQWVLSPLKGWSTMEKMKENECVLYDMKTTKEAAKTEVVDIHSFPSFWFMKQPSGFLHALSLPPSSHSSSALCAPQCLWWELSAAPPQGKASGAVITGNVSGQQGQTRGQRVSQDRWSNALKVHWCVLAWCNTHPPPTERGCSVHLSTPPCVIVKHQTLITADFPLSYLGVFTCAQRAFYGRIKISRWRLFLWCNAPLCGRKWGICALAKPGSFSDPPPNRTADVTPRCSLEPGVLTQLSNARPGGFETDNGAALSDVSLSTEGEALRPRWGEQRHKCLPANGDK